MGMNRRLSFVLLSILRGESVRIIHKLWSSTQDSSGLEMAKRSSNLRNNVESPANAIGGVPGRDPERIDPSEDRPTPLSNLYLEDIA